MIDFHLVRAFKQTAVTGLRLAILLCALSPALAAAEDRLRLATTTSTENSGLLAVLNPVFEAEQHVKVDVIAVGTGKALRLAENGDVDVVLVHAPEAELEFLNAGYGIRRLPVMHNDFVLIGPAADPARVSGTPDVAKAMARIASTQSEFISRGDQSGTHQKELELWRAAGVSPSGNWYLAAGQGMGAILTMSNDRQSYTLTDRGTYLAYRDRLQLKIVFEGAMELHNPYHVILVNPERHPHVNSDQARAYADFLRSEKGQTLIRDFKVSGVPLFFPDALN